MSKNKFTLDIQGMHCRSCEILLERNIGKVKGVTHVKTSFKKGSADIEHDESLDRSLVEKAVISSGYSLGKNSTSSYISKNARDYVELIVAGSVLFFLYALLGTLGVFDLSFDVSGTPGLVGVLLLGLTAGVSTCMALVGGLVLGVSSRHAELHPEATAAQKFRPHIFFNIGRLVSYIVLGGLIGTLGSAFKLSSSLIGFITVFLGVIMLFLGLKLIEIFPKLKAYSVTLPSGISKFFGLSKETKEYSHKGAFITGALTFFIPCGFTQAMQLYAISTGSFTQGALIMGIFALGTLPGILSIGGITSSIKGSFSRYFFKFAGLVVVLLAIFNIVTGWNLTGISLPTTSEKNAPQNEITIIDGKQIVTMTQAGNGYTPKTLTVKKDIPVVWKITSTNQFTCAAYINMPAMGISTPLELGENILEFTPTKTGTLRFTCSMGMYSGSFNVIN